MEETKPTGEKMTSSILVATGRPGQTPAPGAYASPQEPGQVPDRSTVPGHHSLTVSKPRHVYRPLTQYGTAEEIMKTFRRHGNEIEPEQFEQATAAFEELRKALPADLPPVRPVPGYLPAGTEAPQLPQDTSDSGGEF
ncbi:MAG: hypothetical protein ACRDJW_05335 [Thermomicrobiales bacterium]